MRGSVQKEERDRERERKIGREREREREAEALEIARRISLKRDFFYSNTSKKERIKDNR